MNMNNPQTPMPSFGPPNGMHPGGSSKFKPVDPIRVLRASWIWLVLAFVVGGVLGGGAWFGLNKIAPKYTSKARYDVQAANIDPLTGNRTAITSRMTELEPLILREVESAKSEPLLRQILKLPEVQKTKWFQQFNNDMEAAYEELSENVIKSKPVRSTPLFTVSITTPKADDALVLLTAHNVEFTRRQQAQIDTESSRDLQAAQRQLNLAEERITGIRASIRRFFEENQIEDDRGASDEATLRVRDLVVKLSTIGESLASLQGTYDQLLAREQANDFSPSGDERQQIDARPEIVNINNQLLQIELQRVTLVERFGDNYPAVKALDVQTLKLESKREAKRDEFARTLFRAKIEETALNLEIFKSAYNTTSQELTELKVQRQEIVRLRQELDTLNRQLEQAEEDRASARQKIDQFRLINDSDARVIVRVAVPPQVAKQSFPPNPPVLVLAGSFLLTGLVFGIAFLREMTDQRVRGADDVKLVPDASLIASIPEASQEVGKTQKVERVVEQHPSGLLAEAYRQVRTSVLSKIDRRGDKTLMLVSAKPNAGVTSAAQNLAASCALSGRRVLLIDANFRRPGLAKLMGLANEPGLAELLCGDRSLDEASQLVNASSTQNLSLLPAGDIAKAAVELFESPRFRELLSKLEADYDLLIIDTPPALLTSDAKLLSRHVDATLLVTRAGSDTRGMLGRLYRELDGQRADILGTVLNGVQASAGGYLKRNYREFHDYSGPERRRNPRTTTAAASSE